MMTAEALTKQYPLKYRPPDQWAVCGQCVGCARWEGVVVMGRGCRPIGQYPVGQPPQRRPSGQWGPGELHSGAGTESGVASGASLAVSWL